MSAKSKIYTIKNKGFEIFFYIPVLLYHSKNTYVQYKKFI